MVLKILGTLFLLPVFLVSTLLIYWDLREPPSFAADPVLKLEHWTATSEDELKKQHNSNTEMIYFNNSFILIHAQTKWHLEDKSGAFVVKTSPDAKTWTEVTRITLPDTDVRDPKFAIIKGQLFLYFLPNLSFDPLPHTTFWSVSDDGIHWKTPEELTTVTVLHTIGEETRRVTTGGWEFWRPKTRDGKTWYMVAFGKKPPSNASISILVKSTDGINWEEVSEVYTRHPTHEPTMEFLPDGSIISTLRCGSLGTAGYEFGNPTANTVIAVAKYPYKEWTYSYSFITRFDGATLFPVEDRIFATGRNHLGPRFDMGNHLGRKRTAFYEVKPDRLIHLFDLPSNGDTAYTGVVKKGDEIYTSYYTSPIEKDYPWIAGVCFFPKTDVRIAKVSASGLVQYADQVILKNRQRRLHLSETSLRGD